MVEYMRVMGWGVETSIIASVNRPNASAEVSL